jgi:hypothetical protein
LLCGICSGGATGGESAREDACKDADAKFLFAIHNLYPPEKDATSFLFLRGTNENTNGLLRQFFPKGMDFGMVIKLDVDIALEQLNNRPRKCSNYPDTSGQRSSVA